MVNPNWLFVLWGLLTVTVLFLVFSGFTQEASGQIITIQLSKTCITPLKYNLTSSCPNYEELLQFDNTIRAVSGEFGMKDGYFQRLSTPYYKHCNYYLPAAFRVMIVVDPDDCWNKHKGAKTIIIYAIKPQDFIFKPTASSEMADEINDLSKRDRDLFIDRVTYENEIDAKEIAVENSEDKIEAYEDRIEDLDGTESNYVRSNLNRQLGWENERLVDYKTDLATAEANLIAANIERKSVIEQITAIKISLSKSVVGGKVIQGVGRSIDECHDAVIGNDMLLLQDTINFMLKDCGGDTTYDSRKIEYIEQTPINIADHQWYKYKKWMKSVLENCKQKC